MKRAIFFVFVLAVISFMSATTTLASPQGDNGASVAQQPPPPDPRIEIVKAYLALDDTQTGRLATLLRARTETIDPLRRALAQQEQELARLLRAATPDPTVVGSVVITIRGMRGQIETAQDTFRNGFEDLLTERQKRKLDGLEQYIENERAAPAFLGLGLVEVDLGPEPARTLRRALGRRLVR
jgi:hypothetical protein